MTRANTELESTFRLLTRDFLCHADKCGVIFDNSPRTIHLSARPYSYDDKGKLIGGGGTMHRALTVILRAVAIRHNTGCRFAILDSQTEVRDPDVPFNADRLWKPESIMATARQIGTLIFGAVSVRQRSGGIETTIEILTSQGGSDYAATIEHALTQVFHAIGKAQGRMVFVKVLKG